MTSTSHARSFDKAAARYAANRPSCPPALLDAVEELAGRPLTGVRVADIGAGTGLATVLPHARGAHVVAVEPGPGVAARFRLKLPDVPLDTHLANLASHSDFLVLGEDATKTFLAAEHDRLTEVFPDGTVEERYVVSLAVAIR
ncbi:MAG TPA: hypothetical protein VFY14_17185 [Streptomyces sp.]|nr:hypothetical protein [Streptomyces sp.]